MDPKKMAVLLSLNLTLYTVILAPPGGKFKLKTYFLPFAASRLIFNTKLVYALVTRLKFRTF